MSHGLLNLGVFSCEAWPSLSFWHRQEGRQSVNVRLSSLFAGCRYATQDRAWEAESSILQAPPDLLYPCSEACQVMHLRLCLSLPQEWWAKTGVKHCTMVIGSLHLACLLTVVGGPEFSFSEGVRILFPTVFGLIGLTLKLSPLQATAISLHASERCGTGHLIVRLFRAVLECIMFARCIVLLVAKCRLLHSS